MNIDAILTVALALLGVFFFVRLLGETRAAGKTACDGGCNECEQKRTKG